jgi:hypothetical protein
MNSNTFESKSSVLNIINGFKEYAKEHWSVSIILISFLYISKLSNNIISFWAIIPFWVLICNYIDSVKQSERNRIEFYYRNKLISDDLERTKANILDKYGALLKADSYDKLVTELKNLK